MEIKGIWVLLFCIFVHTASAQNVYEVTEGGINFYSDAPQEVIKASSTGLRGILDVNKKTFFFKIPISTFMGFNSPLQREHFNENYMESQKYPGATYSGKIIEDVNLMQDGNYKLRVKGKFKVHGIEQERIINALVVVKKSKININSDFIVSLSDHDIKIPRVMYDKLAPDIHVSVKATLLPKR